MSSPIGENQYILKEKVVDANLIDELISPQTGLQSRTSYPAIERSTEPAAKTQTFSRTISKPRLQAPELSTLNIIALLREFQRTNSSSDVSLALAHAQQITNQLDINRATELENQKEIDKKNAEIDEKQKTKKIIDIVLSVVGLVFSIIAAVGAYLLISALTAGAAVATGPAVFMAVTMMVGAIGGLAAGATSCANLIVHEQKRTRTNVFNETVPLEISIAGLDELVQEDKVRKNEILVIGHNASAGTPNAISRKEFNTNTADSGFRASIIFSGAMILLSIASIVQAIVGLVRSGTQIAAATVPIIAKITAAASKINTATAVVMTVGTAASAATGVYSGILSLGLAELKKALAETTITEKMIEAAIQILQQQFDANQQQFRGAMDFQENLRTRIANIMADYFESQITIAKNTRV